MKFLIVFILLFSQFSYAKQLNDTAEISKKSKMLFQVAVPSALAATQVALYFAWYKSYNTQKFHFFNDAKEWQGMDKLGHSFSTYQFSKTILHYSTLAKYTKRKQQLLHASYGLLFLTAIEIQDGFSDGWGFSSADMFANIGGTLLAVGQFYGFKNRYPIQLKFNYFPSQFPKYRPELLGSNGIESILKDYNAQQYWLSIFPGQFYKKSKIPPYIGLSIGYSATGMTGGFSNPLQNSKGQILPLFAREKQYGFSLDFDLSKIPVKNKFLKHTLQIVSFIKIPFPQIYFKQGKLFGKWY